MALRNIEDLIALNRDGRRLMALDVGAKTVGYAVTAAEGVVLPVGTLRRGRGRQAQTVTAIAAEARARDIAGIAVGYPLNMDSSVGPAAQKARAFAHAVATALPDVAVALVDERLTTDAALEQLEGRATQRQAKASGALDALAAAAILQGLIGMRPLSSEE